MQNVQGSAGDPSGLGEEVGVLEEFELEGDEIVTDEGVVGVDPDAGRSAR